MPVTPLQSNKESERNNNRNSKRRKSKFSFLTSQFFPSTINSLDDESNIAIIALPANPKGLKPAVVETKQHYTKEERQTSFNFIDESIGDPFIFYQILSYLPVSSHLSTSLDMGKIFSFDYCVQYTRRELYKKMEHSLLNCMLVHPRWYELIDKDVFFKIMVNSQFSKYFQFYYNERVCNNTSTNDIDRFWRNTLRDIVENFRWSPFISREKEYFYNYWDSKDHGVLSFLSDCFQDDLITESSSGIDSYSMSSDKSVFEMIRDGSEKVYICRGGRIQGNGKVIQAPIEKIPRLKCTYQLFRTDKPILCDMIVDFQVCNLPVRKSDETCIPPSHEMLNIHQDNFILLGIIDSDLLNSRGDYLSCPEQTSLVTDVMTESSSAKFNYLGEYNLQSRFRGRQREINLNLGYASNGFISYSTIIDGKFTERWRIGDIISFEIRGINSFLEKTATSRKKEYASVTIIRNGRFVCHVEDFMILNRIVSIRENSPNPFPKLYYFACNFYYGSVASSLNQTPQSNSLLPTLPNQNSNNYVPAIRINRVTYL